MPESKELSDANKWFTSLPLWKFISLGVIVLVFIPGSLILREGNYLIEEFYKAARGDKP